ncbi:RSP_2648 family PIN domain-containing protein [Marinibacterium sp. SX1]|uniref:RSP_2648 family PIN domain-containing protein n=1 Tax=Marinibacterium sp. SX1 TaxID=3388424 RepID=UPI003D17C8A6
MKVVLDACVLYPTVMRALLLAGAEEGGYRPAWSARILEEWARAAGRAGPLAETRARGEIALLRAAWPGAEITPQPGTEARLWLPDPSDLHVLAAAVDGSADAIVTMNAKDFPRGTLAEEGLQRLDPDGFLLELWQANPGPIETAARSILDLARREDASWQMRALLKKARLPRLGKALG